MSRERELAAILLWLAILLTAILAANLDDAKDKARRPSAPTTQTREVERP